MPGTADREAVLDSAVRERTRVLVLFGLAGRVAPPGPGASGHRLVDAFDFGRFTQHLRSGEPLLPVAVLIESVAPGELRLPERARGLALTGARILLVTTPRGDATLLLDCDFADETPADAVASWLAGTCFDRHAIHLGARPLLDALTDRLGLSEPLAFGQNVHQLVFPGGRLREELLHAQNTDETLLAEPLGEMIYRGRLPGPAAAHPGAARVPHLHHHGVTLTAHGRGVSVQTGWAPHVENGLAVVALCMVSALSVLQRTRLAAFDVMRANEQAPAHSPAEIRTLISRLSAGVNELQLDLAFGVEAYVDSLLIPEMVTEGFQSSLRDTLGVRDSLDNSARMVERLTSVINARSAALDAALAERAERRDRTVSGLVAAATLIALPPTLLLAFFGVNGTNVDDHRSIFDLREYGTAYVVAWLPFVALVLIGWVLLRRAARRSRTLLTDPGDAPARAPAVVPAPRPPSGS
ncbi:hypothetical protein [Streptomyces sp. NPDC051677]|uniref:hypothetical protein n=1 Tax=Streptomyces sp. NPDC051677 TaxID=3365669 RepID=UPI0037D056DD